MRASNNASEYSVVVLPKEVVAKNVPFPRRDFAHVRLVQEVEDIQESVAILHRKLQDAEAQHQQLLKVKSQLENNLKKKVNALFIDREKCMGIRRCFPVDSLIKY